MKILFILTLIVLAALGCTKEYMNEKELKEFLANEKNGLKKKINQGEYELTSTYRPADLLVMQELRRSVSRDSSVLQALERKYKGQYYFILAINRNGKEAITPTMLGKDGFAEVLDNISFRMGKFVDITAAKDTIALKDFVFDRTFGMGSNSEILLVFEKEKLFASKLLQINVKEFGLGIGTQHFTFDKAKLDDVPRIDIK